MSLLGRKHGVGVPQEGDGNGHSDRQTGARQPSRPVPSVPHFPRLALRRAANLAPTLRIRCDVLLQLQIIQQIEIRVHLVIAVQSLQIADCAAHRRHTGSLLSMFVP